MLDSLTQFGTASSGIGALGFNVSDFLIQLLTFIIALLILKRWAFKPILKIMNERRETIEKGVMLGEQMEKERKELDAKVEQTLHETRKQSDTIIAEAQDAARRTIAEAEEKARQKASSLIAEAEERITRDTARARKSLEKELVGLIADTTEAIIEEKVDARKDAEFIERRLKERQTV